MLECFNRERKLIFLNNTNMPKWIGSNLGFVLTKNIFEFISLVTINCMITEIYQWILCNTSLSTDKIIFCNAEIKKWAQLDYLWICKITERMHINESKKLLLSYCDKIVSINLKVI